MSYHDEIVRVMNEDGDEESVYRYLRKCKHCIGWTGQPQDRFATCSRLHKQTSRDITSCKDFIATDAGLNQMWIETEARNGDEYCRIQYKEKTYFVDRVGLIDLIGWDPDEAQL